MQKNKPLMRWLLKKVVTLKRSIWTFPVLLAIPIIILTALGISGTSIGIYHKIFYGEAKDPNLIFNEPLAIRSDEWIVNSQLTIAQENSNYERVNENIGNGHDLSMLADAPYKDWSALFKPHNLAFFILPFDNAFAFRWWIMAYLLIISSYFFILKLLPDRKLLAAILSTSLLFSPFIQLWYLSGTLGSMYYLLFAGILCASLFSEKNSRSKTLLWTGLLAYVTTCFVLLIYPPFQIITAFVMMSFLIGYLIENRHKKLPIPLPKRILSVVIAGVIALTLTFVFLSSRTEIVNTVRNTVYPGKRIEKSGGFDEAHFFSSHLSYQHQFQKFSSKYFDTSVGLVNQSENSNFILIIPFLLIPILILLFYDKRERKTDWPLLLTTLAFLFILIWLFVPGIKILGRVTLFEIIPPTRFLIGIGLLNLIMLVLFIRRYSNVRLTPALRILVIFYSLVVLIVQLLLGLYTMQRFPEFISVKKVVVFSVPIPVICYLLLTKRNILAVLGVLAFSIFSTYKINPLYKGTAVLTETPLSKAIQQIIDNNDDGKKWATEVSALENFASMNGAPSLTGVYTYPQLDIWDDTGKENAHIYNRYAHVVFTFDRDYTKQNPTKLQLAGGDNFGVLTEPCGQFMNSNNVGYLLTEVPIEESEKCISLLQKVSYPSMNLYIYKRSD